LGGDPPQPQVLAGEIRRTMAAVQNQLGGRKVESVVLCGRSDSLAELAQRLEKDLDVPTELFDPFEGLSLSAELRDAPPEHSGRFAPLLGLLLAELEHTGHAVDFLHPRRRAEPPRKWKKFVLPAVAAAVLIVGYFAWQMWDRSDLNGRIEKLNAQLADLKDKSKDAEKLIGAVGEIEKWTSTDFCWLDELETLSRKFPPATEAMVTLPFTMQTGAKGGDVTLSGLAKSTATLEEMRKSAARNINMKSSSADAKTPPYTLQFSGTIMMDATEGRGK
jgi:hypothetical protein